MTDRIEQITKNIATLTIQRKPRSKKTVKPKLLSKLKPEPKPVSRPIGCSEILMRGVRKYQPCGKLVSVGVLCEQHHKEEEEKPYNPYVHKERMLRQDEIDVLPQFLKDVLAK